MGQSLDGFIATRTGASHYVTGQESLVHLHRMRALMDAVVVGWRTAQSDDPQLNVRLAEGPNPARVLVDLDERLDRGLRAFRPGARVLHVVGEDRPVREATADHVERVPVPRPGGRVDPKQLLRELAERGLPRVLVEGGGALVSAFLRAGALDRLHVVVAPLLIGEGRPGVQVAPVDDLGDALRPPAEIYRLGADVLFDLELG
ncbi:Riboflavin biosynthesis protein RibD [Planctomycetes bacterium Poly30]|uniref:Riboflavin biosynthesis protein RibD n=1 Tax=Saltatorellus ferox TaxID=2528018 RepID=A0A518EYD2_9BACT|nr:Riboflavin biosynthesis protein RibD [Planctomycetes bacterium Poly30]